MLTAISRKYGKVSQLLLLQRNLSSTVDNLGLQHVKTKVLLQRLPLTATEANVTEAVKDLNCRRVEVEPGCSISFSSEIAAIRSKELVSKLGYGATIKPTIIPALLIQNMNNSVKCEDIAASFQHSDPKLIRLLSSASIQIICANSEEALRIQPIINNIVINNNKLQSYSLLQQDGRTSIQVYNLPESGVENVKKSITEAIATIKSLSPVDISASKAASQSIKLRFKHGQVDEALVNKLKQCEINGSKITSVSKTPYKIPSVFLRNVDCMKESDMKQLLTGHKYTRIQMLQQSKDVQANLAVAYFTSEEDAAKCFYDIRNNGKRNVNGDKIEASLKFTTEPAVKITNLPENASKDALNAFLNRYEVVNVSIDNSSRSAIVTFSSPKHAELAVEGLHQRVIDGNIVKVEGYKLCDEGVELVVSQGLAQMTGADIIAALQSKYNINNILSASIDSNTTAVVGFSTVENAIKASKHFNDKIAGKVAPLLTANSSMLRSKLTSHPAYVVEVTNFPVSKPASELQAALSAEKGFDSNNSPVMWNRNAIIKFKRHMDVVPGMKKLKAVAFDADAANKVIVSKYRPEAVDGTSSYDTLDDMDKFDSLMNKDMNTEFLNTNPATRYQLLKNTFERSLFDAKIRQDASLLVDASATTAMKKEVVDALKQFHNATPDANTKKVLEDRLFELYLQRKDFSQFTKGFNDLSVLFGEANEKNPMDWSQFTEAALPADFTRIQKKLLAMDQEALNNPEIALGLKPAGKGSLFHKDEAKRVEVPVVEEAVIQKTPEELRKIALEKKMQKEAEEQEHMLRFGYKQKKDEDEDEIDKRDPMDRGEYSVVDDDGATQVISMEDPLMLRDKTGFSWSGIVLDNDSTQKTMPGGRVMSHRCLVVVGNLRGTAGFGKGKGKNPDDALNAAFRDALRNLLHVDLYDNYGLCHDVHGKHNACHAYIRHTSKERMMIASPFASEILLRFGISTVSCKMVGRRDPYAQVRSIFNALSKHMNIDEIAKMRGKRYYTLKYALDHKV